MTGLSEAAPELQESVLGPRALTVARAVLGEPSVERTGAVVSDASRPFFAWHTHIDAEDDGVRVARRVWPPKSHIGRLIAVLYLDDLDDDGGPLLVWPRRVGDPTTPPHDLRSAAWPGQVVLQPSAGSLVLLDECTWHAARSRRRPGWRIFLGAFLAARQSA